MQCIDFLKDMRAQIKEDMQRDNQHYYNSLKLQLIVPPSLIQQIEKRTQLTLFESSPAVYDIFDNKNMFVKDFCKKINRHKFVLIQCSENWAFVDTGLLKSTNILDVFVFFKQIDITKNFKLSISSIKSSSTAITFESVSLDPRRVFVI
ncbi:hypothetical protein EIN_248190 [Entamoeba invadens IP1]|uniref:Uncharacterized protein n=1 Tax=Entamoeba invadens IP1 TaxID=370355 RepID=A0A0A1UE34_ENTIV|nr:hypothetical protein EIN_248190 [Entamoeba invadens IP1]ELP94855.1 hypothetical protein EIN_248190 [Entamoeba invadens IP1]|eukprot:XP_004261626.1 hypothetical protein EIN_248190 [Entamoeba invadens IP1]